MSKQRVFSGALSLAAEGVEVMPVCGASGVMTVFCVVATLGVGVGRMTGVLGRKNALPGQRRHLNFSSSLNISINTFNLILILLNYLRNTIRK